MFSVPDGEIAVYGAESTRCLGGVADGPGYGVTENETARGRAGSGRVPRGRARRRAGACRSSLFRRSKALARAWVAEAARITKGPVIIDGSKTDGIEGLWREARKQAPVSDALSKHHGKVAVIAEGARFDDWEDPGVRDIGGFVTRLGVFSADGVDPGSAALAEVLPAKLGPRVADLGAGWGYLSRAILDAGGRRGIASGRSGPGRIGLCTRKCGRSTGVCSIGQTRRPIEAAGFRRCGDEPALPSGSGGAPGAGYRLYRRGAATC